MSLKPFPVGPIPEMTALVARAAFPKGNLYMRLRDELGTLYSDQDFVALYPTRGQPGLPAWRLALVTVMQFLENLSDRQAADAVRARIDWKYMLGLELTDAGFHHSVLGEFRERLIEGDSQHLLLERMLEHFREKNLLKIRGRQRTDSTHVLASIRVMNRLELVGETLRAALNDLAVADPEWLRSVAPAEWHERYSQRIEESRLPRGDKARQEFAQKVGEDGFALLSLLDEIAAPAPVKDLPVVETLRQVWERHYERTEAGQVLWRAGPDLSRAAGAIESPYDPEARHSNKHSLSWTGYAGKTRFTLSACYGNLRRGSASPDYPRSYHRRHHAGRELYCRYPTGVSTERSAAKPASGRCRLCGCGTAGLQQGAARGRTVRPASGRQELAGSPRRLRPQPLRGRLGAGTSDLSQREGVGLVGHLCHEALWLPCRQSAIPSQRLRRLRTP
jgi:transposase